MHDHVPNEKGCCFEREMLSLILYICVIIVYFSSFFLCCISTCYSQLVQRYGIARDLLPPKRLTGNFSPKLIEVRREALEHYLQRLVNRYEVH